MTHAAKPTSVNFTAEQRAAQRAIHERSKQESAEPNEFLASGDIKEIVPNWQAYELASLVGKLRKERERRGLSLNDVSTQSGLTKAQISELENHRRLNPTLETLYRYALAIGMHIRLIPEEAGEPCSTSGKPAPQT